MDEGASLFVTYILPPVLGALIGYVTNAIAIRMLFRPFREWRVLGIRVPFTPGIIPRQRGMIARSIGHMVARELLNEKVLRRRLDSVKFTKGFKTAVGGFTGHILAIPVGPGLKGRYAESARILCGSLEAGLAGLVDSDEFADLVAGQIEKLAGLLPSSPGPLIGDFLSGPVPARLLDFLAEELLEGARKGVSLSSIFPLPSREDLAVLLERAYGPVFARISDLALGDDVRREAVRRGRIFLRKILGDLSFFQRLVLNAGQYDLDERMPEIVDGLIRAAVEAGTEGPVRKRMAAALAGEILRLAELPLTESFALFGFEVPEAAERFKEFIKRGLEEPEFHELLRRIAAALIETRRDLARAAADYVVRRARAAGSDGLSRIFSGLADALLPAARGRPLGELLAVSRENKEKLDLFLTEGLFALTARKLPEILKSFEIEELIVERINELDVEEVEDLLLSVISRHLAWINLFGGILGALIGFSQVVVQIVRTR
jgi:uncharacterized membrane protein YheB (UPF0754 family)